MTLISLLLVLALERITTKNDFWRSEFYLASYYDFVVKKSWLDDSAKTLNLILVIGIPTLITWLIQTNLDSSLLELLFGCAVLMMAIGCPHLREKYKGYLQAANRGDMQACDLYAQELDFEQLGDVSFGQHVVWINFRFYMAVVLWFTFFGAAGVVLYSVARYVELAQRKQESPMKTEAHQILHVLDWVPARIAGIGFLLVGHFTRAVSSWIDYLVDLKIDAKVMLTTVAKAAEDVEPDEHDCTEEPCTLLRLAKRNLILVLAVIAVLTLGGWIN